MSYQHYSNSKKQQDLSYSQHRINDPEEEEQEVSYTSNRDNYIPDSSISESENRINVILKDLHAKLLNIDETISRKEEEKMGILDDIGVLTRRLETLKKSLSKKAYLLEDLDKLVKDSENAFGKIILSTKSLLNVVKKENATFDREYSSANRLF